MRSLLFAALLAAGLALLSTGCAGGKYVLDVFPEMHYQPSYRAQEPPSLAPPAEAVPVTGKDQAEGPVEVPNLLFARPTEKPDGARLFRVNCAPCHGATGKGDGLLAAYFRASGARPPADLTSSEIQARGEAGLHGAIADGVRDPETLVGMPAFRNLLGLAERQELVAYIQSLGGR